MSEIRTPIGRVLERLAELQTRTSPIDLTIGGTNSGGTVVRDVVTIRNAAPTVVSAVVSEFPMVSLGPTGLVIPVVPFGE